MCLKKIIQTFKFRKQCIWALNYWHNQYNYVEIQEKIEQSDGDQSADKYDDNIPLLIPVLEEQCVDDLLDKYVNQGTNKNINHIEENIFHEVESKSSRSCKRNGGKKGIRKYEKKPAQICPYCGVLRVCLRSHMLMHSESEPQPEFICDICGKSFQRRAQIYRHTRIHIDIR